MTRREREQAAARDRARAAAAEVAYPPTRWDWPAYDEEESADAA